MATRAFDNRQILLGTGRQPMRPELTHAVPLFSQSEFQVIRIAQTDSIWSILPSSRLVRLIGRLFGIHPQNALADPRLEAIRRFAVAMKSDAAGRKDIERQLFYNAGFSTCHADFIIRRMNQKLPLSQR